MAVRRVAACGHAWVPRDALRACTKAHCRDAVLYPHGVPQRAQAPKRRKTSLAFSAALRNPFYRERRLPSCSLTESRASSQGLSSAGTTSKVGTSRLHRSGHPSLAPSLSQCTHTDSDCTLVPCAWYTRRLPLVPEHPWECLQVDLLGPCAPVGDNMLTLWHGSGLQVRAANMR